ncbi:MAG: FMN-binding negative transcriptional regulator [Alphaproteobacteria bacterium]|nr:FMN-binding negative transcriptional regulator [Alphaproteobacteria bacterium]
MYVPRQFTETDENILFDLMQSDPFAVLVTTIEGRPDATHLPVLIDRDTRTIRCHLAHANPAAHVLEEAGEVLFVFEGAHAYISPDWYESHGQVPTWNYAVVHAYGTARRMTDAETVTLLDDVSAQEEERLLPKKPWTNDKLGDKLFTGLRKALIGFEIMITDLQGKWKLSQNKTPADRAGAAAALEQRGRPGDLAVAAMMRAVDAD